MIVWTHRGDGGAHAVAGAFVRARLGYVPDAATAMAVVTDARLRAVVLFHDWRPDHGTVEITAAASGAWVTRGVLREIGGYAFGQLGAQALVARIDAGAAGLRRMLERAGCAMADVPHMRGPGRSETVAVMTAAAWVGMEKVYGKQAACTDTAA